MSGLGECAADEVVEVGDEALAFRQEPAFGDKARADAALDPLDQRRVLAADLVVPRQRLLDPGRIRIRGEEVVEEARRPLGGVREDGADG